MTPSVIREPLRFAAVGGSSAAIVRMYRPEDDEADGEFATEWSPGAGDGRSGPTRRRWVGCSDVHVDRDRGRRTRQGRIERTTPRCLLTATRARNPLDFQQPNRGQPERPARTIAPAGTRHP